MKRILLRRGAIIAACAAIVLGSCTQPSEEARIDTVYSLDRPEVTAKAYPGMNVISWKPVTGAIKYDVSVYEEGVFKTVLSVSGCSATDFSNLVNGKNYTYYVEVQSETNPSGNRSERTVYAKNNRGEASVKAIVPPFGTKPLELPAYEKGYDGTAKTVENDEYVVSPSNINVAVADGKIAVTFPTKTYLDYTVKYYDNDLVHEENINNGTDPYTNTGVTNNTFGQSSFAITEAGKYQIAINAKSRNDAYVNKDEVIYGELVTVEKLNLDDETGSVSAEYVLDDDKFVENADKTVRVSFTPAKLNGDNVPTSWYTVYRRVEGEYENTKLSAVKESSQNSSTYYASTDYTYYVDDEVPDVAKKYIYTVVVTDGKKYGNKKTVKLNRDNKVGNITGVSADGRFDADAKKVSWTIEASGIAATPGVKLVAKSLIVQDNRNATVLANEIFEKGKEQGLIAVELPDGATDKQFKTETSVTNDATVYLVVQATLDGYTTTYVVADTTVEY